MIKQNKKANFFGWMVGGIFLFIGLLFTIISVGSLLVGQNFRKTAKETQGTIVDFKRTSSDDSPTVYVRYNVDGRDYVNTINYYSSSMHYGDTLTIFYQPANPLSIQCKEGDMFLQFVFMPIGIIFMLVGVFFGVQRHISNLRDKHLLQHGDRLLATISEVVENTSTTMNGRHPYIVHCYYKAPNGAVYDFKSRSLWCKRYELPDAGTVPVYVSGLNYKKYVVDVNNIEPADNQQSTELPKN